MHSFQHTIYKLQQEIGDELIWVQALGYPEIDRLKEGLRVETQFDSRLVEITQQSDLHAVGQRVFTNAPEINHLTLKLRPSTKVEAQRAWIEPIEISLPYVAWQRDEQLVSAFVPALGLTVLKTGKLDPKFVGELRIEARSSLIRSGQLEDLCRLPSLAGFGDLELDEHQTEIRLPSAKQVAQEEPEEDREDELSIVATRVDAFETGKKKNRKNTPDPLPGFCLDEIVRKLAEAMQEPDRHSVLLVGPTGVGKTQTLLELGKRKGEFGFAERSFWETSGSRIVAGMSGFGQWQERCQRLTKSLKQQDGILLVGNLLELLEVGRSSSQSQTVASWMQAQVQRGSLQVVAECTPEQLSMIEQREPILLATLTVLRIDKPNEEMQKSILSSVADHLLKRLPENHAVTISEPGLDAIYRLHHRYTTYSANPGRPIQFLQRLIEDVVLDPGDTDAALDIDCVIDADRVSRSFSTQTGLPYFLLSQTESLKLDELSQWFSKRVIGQPDPVRSLVDLIATVKAGLTTVGKPIASLMFIGPTGVGKTEMAKALAEFMFSSQQRMLRFDMSEFGDSHSVQRLIGGPDGKEGLLTGKVKQHPFSVVLFDEFEKAHPAFFDLLLQVLGEGRLTDGRGQTTDFSTTIIVITSNLGAEQFKPIAFGFSDPNETEAVSQRRYEEHFVEQVRSQLRPELFNRIDRILPFRPLQIDSVKQIVRREIEKLKRREGIWQRGVELNVSDQVADQIATASMDLRYGARPIQRLIHETLTVPLADRLAGFSANQSIAAAVEIDDRDKIRIQVRGTEPKLRNRKSIAAVINDVQSLRRRGHQLVTGDAMIRMRNEMYQLLQSIDRSKKNVRKLQKKKNEKLADKIAALEASIRSTETEASQYRHFIDKSGHIFDECATFEEQTLMQHYAQEKIDLDAVQELHRSLSTKLKKTIFENFLFDAKTGDKATVILWCRNPNTVNQMLRGYLAFSQRYDLRATGFRLDRYNPAMADHVQGTLVRESDQTKACDVFQLSQSRLFDQAEARLALGISFTGPAAWPMFGYEAGRHFFKTKYGTEEVFVQLLGGRLLEHEIADSLMTVGPFDGFPVQRTYQMQRHQVEDKAIGKLSLEEGVSIQAAVTKSLEACLEYHLNKYIQ